MSTSPILLSVKFDAVIEGQSIKDGLGKRPIVDWHSKDRPASLKGIKYALVWEIDDALFSSMPDLEVIFSAGAGVDKILNNPTVPKDIPIVRFVDPSLTTRMTEWICLQCLMHLRQQRQYDELQNKHEWHQLPQPQASEVNVGIMGLGILGQDAAQKLQTLGFQVSGWSRSRKEIEGMRCYDANETDTFLREVHYLVGLLPLTNDTKGFFNRGIFEKLSRHEVLGSPVFINGGRGQSQSQADILDCLKDGTLGGVSLDVFETEPLSADSPLWDFPNAYISPHVAANSDVLALGSYVERQIQRYEAGKALENVVDREAGY